MSNEKDYGYCVELLKQCRFDGTCEECLENIKNEKDKKGMKTFAIRIEEVLAKTVLIDAEDLESAIERVAELYQDGQIEVKDIDDTNVDKSQYSADENGVFTGTEEEQMYYEKVE